MSARTAEPLPECNLCEVPTARAAWEANGGLCSGCTRGIADTVRMLPAGRGLVDIDRLRRQRLLERTRPWAPDDAQTVFVERYVPPVPGEEQ